MVKFINKSTEITMALDAKGEDTKILNYSDLIMLILNHQPKEGWTTSEMRSRIRIEAKVEDLKTDELLELEDAEYDKIVNCLGIPWTFKHKSLIKFEDYILNLRNKS